LRRRQRSAAATSDSDGVITRLTGAFKNLSFDLDERTGKMNMENLKFAKELIALLVIDPYNDFISEGGKVAVVSTAEIVDTISSL
jgi:hypothetical protein